MQRNTNVGGTRAENATQHRGSVYKMYHAPTRKQQRRRQGKSLCRLRDATTSPHATPASRNGGLVPHVAVSFIRRSDFVCHNVVLSCYIRLCIVGAWDISLTVYNVSTNFDWVLLIFVADVRLSVAVVRAIHRELPSLTLSVRSPWSNHGRQVSPTVPCGLMCSRSAATVAFVAPIRPNGGARLQRR